MEPLRQENLRPEMTVTEVAAILGEPGYLGEHRLGRDEFFGFEAERGDFEVIKQHVSSEGSEVDRWFLRYRPRDCASLVDSRLLEQVQNLEHAPSKVTMFSGLGQKGKASLEFGQEPGFSAIWWLQQDEMESAPRSSQTQATQSARCTLKA